MSLALSAAGPAGCIDGVVQRLVRGSLPPGSVAQAHGAVFPSRDNVAQAVLALRAALFPVHFGSESASERNLTEFVQERLNTGLLRLQVEVSRALSMRIGSESAVRRSADHSALEVLGAFADELPTIQALLATDLRAAYEGDPAATSPDEALYCYPGVNAVIHHRIAHALHRAGAPIIPRIIAEIAHAVTGIDIHPGAEIGESFFIDHGTGVVIGETCLLGNRVRIYQGVTLGAKSFPLDERGWAVKGELRHPVVGDDVVIYAGATILGRITIGEGSTIAGNVWLTRSVPPNSRVTQAHVVSEVFANGSGI
jgi:serine O-acetyltransferase